jgi:hypothetical protein
MKMHAKIFVSSLLIFLNTIFTFYRPAFADDTALRQLRDIRVSVNVPENSGTLSFQLQNMLELNLRKAGLTVRSDATAELRLSVFWVDIDPQQNRILGKYGVVQLSLHEPVMLLRDRSMTIRACTWEGIIAMLHGPPDTFAERTRQWSSDLTDDFLNRWMKAKEQKTQTLKTKK